MDKKQLEGAVFKALQQAHLLDLRSISIPAVSSGIFGFPTDLCAEIMFRMAEDFDRMFPDSSLKSVSFTNIDAETVHVFQKEFERRYTKAEKSKEEKKKEEDEEETGKKEPQDNI